MSSAAVWLDLATWVWVGAAIGVLVVLLVAVWCSWTAGRLDRMHLRCEAADAGLQAQLVRRSSLATEMAAGGLTDSASALLLVEAAAQARESTGAEQWQAESNLTEVLHLVTLPGGSDEPLTAALVGTSRQLTMARRIHNDLVATTVALRNRRRVRWFRLAGHAVPPRMAEFDDRPL